MMTLNTDELIDILDTITMGKDQTRETLSEWVAKYGVDYECIYRTFRTKLDVGEGRIEAAHWGFILGLVLGKMNLDPIEPVKHILDGMACNCVGCQLLRAMLEGNDE